MQHFDFIEGQSKTLRITPSRFYLPLQQRFRLFDPSLKFLIILLVHLSRIQKRPSKEILDVFPPDLLFRCILEPLRQVAFRVRNILMATLKQLCAVFARDSRWMRCCSLQVDSARVIDKEVEGGFKDRPELKDPRNVEGRSEEERADGVENT